jgi:hypothetical protein
VEINGLDRFALVRQGPVSGRKVMVCFGMMRWSGQGNGRDWSGFMRYGGERSSGVRKGNVGSDPVW